MQQKLLIKVTMTDPKKSRVKAMKIAATVSGVESVSLKGEDKDQIEVIGEHIDAVELAKLLRKKVGRADFLSVGPSKEEKKATENKSEVPMVPIVCGQIPPPYAYSIHEFRDQDPGCSIM